jgi:redox-sensitive bicupin YhaK (pirin superfamily)
MRIHKGQMLREGAGVKLRRYIGIERHNDLDPFLLLDVFNSRDPMDYIAGFPPHPHRGFETITYLFQGQIVHEDNQAHKGIISAGDVQWMTAGRGIIHSEMPQDVGHLWGLQLWLNLPAAQKMMQPRYQEYKASELPVVSLANGVIVKVIAGSTTEGTTSPIQGVATQPIFFDISLPRKQSYTLQVPSTHQSILFVVEGELSLPDSENPSSIGQDTLITMNTTSSIIIQGESNCRCLFIAAKKIGEPVERLGPFVMNTREEVLQAVDDFQNQRF